MGVYNTLASTRKEQFKQHKLDHTQEFFGVLGSRDSALTLYLEGRDGDVNNEADAIFFPDDSFALFQLSYVMLNSDGTEVDFETSIHTVSKDGSANISINSDTNVPSVIQESSSGTGTEAVTLTSVSNNEAIALSATQDATDNTVYVHAQLELLAFASKETDYLRFQSN